MTVNHPDPVARFDRIARAELGDEAVRPFPRPVMGGEDFAFYGREIPACFFIVGLLAPGMESMPDLHQPTFDFNDDAIATGIELFCRLALS